MQVKIGQAVLELVEGDITRQDTEALVNAANEHLRVGGGVDGAINLAGGPAIQEEARKIGHCPTGQAVITTGGNLKAKFVIHTVGPIYRDGRRGEPELLASAYRESLKTASAKGIKSLAFPSLVHRGLRLPGRRRRPSGPYHRQRLPQRTPGDRTGALRPLRSPHLRRLHRSPA